MTFLSRTTEDETQPRKKKRRDTEKKSLFSSINKICSVIQGERRLSEDRARLLMSYFSFAQKVSSLHCLNEEKKIKEILISKTIFFSFRIFFSFSSNIQSIFTFHSSFSAPEEESELMATLNECKLQLAFEGRAETIESYHSTGICELCRRRNNVTLFSPLSSVSCDTHIYYHAKRSHRVECLFNYEKYRHA